jgi:hypothetical protein
MSAYNTNLAAEFHVLAMLYCCGMDASLTLGNKKAVDTVELLERLVTKAVQQDEQKHGFKERDRHGSRPS